LHVGSCIARKRVDFLLEVFAAVRQRVPELRLVKVGGSWTAEQAGLIGRLGLEGTLVHLQGVERTTLAALYRQAALVLLPSDAEGFGLPVLEALACGAVVLASDLPVLRELGGSAALYAPILDLESWREQVERLLARPEGTPAREDRLARARQFTWEKHVRIIAEAYLGLAT
jgi:glycosyltransferase involved in cell wall biosynthesis